MKVSGPTKERYIAAGNSLKEAMLKRGYEAYFVETAEEAKELAIKLIPEGASVHWAGSETIKEIGLADELRSGKYKIFDREAGKTKEEKEEIMRQGLLADVFIMSTNAVTKNGELINADGRGNRVAALCYGPKEVITIFGINKLTSSIETGVDRIKNYAGPVNAKRLKLATPCAEKGYCMNCHGGDCICSDYVITRQAKPEGRIKAIIVAEDLGY